MVMMKLYRPFAGGIIATPILFPDGAVGAPAKSYTNDTDLGEYRIGANNEGFSAGGVLIFDYNASRVNFAVPIYLSDDLIITREAAAILQLGLDAAGVTDQIFKGPDRITSDGVGGNLTIAGGRNRGASAGGSIIFQTSPAAGAGVTGTLATALTIASDKSATFTGQILSPDGSAAAPSLGFINFPGVGLFVMDSNYIRTGVGFLANSHIITGTSLRIGSDTGALYFGGGYDLVLTRDAANTLALKNANADQHYRIYGANGTYRDEGALSELTTIAAAAFTDTTIQIPANAVVFGVSGRVTIQPPNTTTVDCGVSGATVRYATGVSTVAGSTWPGALDGTRAYTSAISIRLTPNATPTDTTGRIRITIHYYTITPSTS